MTRLWMSAGGMRALAFLSLLPFIGCAAMRADSVPASDATVGNSLEVSDGWVGEGLAVLDDVTYGAAKAAPGEPAELFFLDNSGDGLADMRVSRSSGSSEANAGAAPKVERMLIYSGDVRVEVARAEDAAKEFLAKVEEWGGYLQSQSGTELQVRIPAKHFEDAFAAVRAAGRVLSESRQSNDVTEEFVDLGIRVENARKSRERLLEILKLAIEVEDILKVEKELRRLTEEIERMEGRLKFLRDQVSMSTLRAQFQSVAVAPPVRHTRRQSRFRWINRIGASRVMEGF
jgi:hypothetical protein